MSQKQNPPINDGGPAFPKPATLDPRTGQPWNEHSDGMSLRDYFAANAMRAIITHAYPAVIAATELELKAAILRRMAPAAYEFADAMIAQRDKKP